MQTDNRLFDDLARVATGALGALSGVRNEVEGRLREQFERVLSRMDLVSREEFEAVKAMAAKARLEQEALQARVAALEAALLAAATPAAGGGSRAGTTTTAAPDPNAPSTSGGDGGGGAGTAQAP
jgi:BMFP domain-containing protein YqiC